MPNPPFPLGIRPYYGSNIFLDKGRRPGNEDRAACRTVKTGLTGSKPVQIFAVLDGHGGEVIIIKKSYNRKTILVGACTMIRDNTE